MIRIYNTLNEIRTLLLTSWVSDAHQQINCSQDFTDNYNKTRKKYIRALRDIFIEWGNTHPNRGGLFKNNFTLVWNEALRLGDDELAQYLVSNPKQIKQLPGALQAIAHQVLAHDAGNTLVLPNTISI